MDRMTYLTCGELQIPTTQITGLSYTKAARVQENRHHCRFLGMNPIEISVSLSITPATTLADSLSDDVKFWLTRRPLKESRSPVYLCGNPVCSQLMFTLTSVNHTIQCDTAGNVVEIQVQLVLSGTECVKAEATNVTLANDGKSSVLPSMSISVGGVSADVGGDVAMESVVLSPTTAHFEFLLSTSFREASLSWLTKPTQADDSFVDVHGYGRWFIRSAAFDDSNLLTLECTPFPMRLYETVTMSEYDVSAKDILRRLGVDGCHFDDFPLEYFHCECSRLEAVRRICENTGLLVSVKDNKVVVFDVPVALTSDDIINEEITEDLRSAVTTGIVLRDGQHEYSYAASSSSVKTLTVPFTVGVNRAKRVLDYMQLLESDIVMSMPWDDRIKPASVFSLLYRGKPLSCMVTDYSINLATSTMTLQLVHL